MLPGRVAAECGGGSSFAGRAVFVHFLCKASISHFIDRVGRDGFGAIFDGLNDELLRLGLLSPEMYVDSSLVKANVSGYGLQPSGLTVAEFKEQGIEENGLFVLTGTTADEDGVEYEEVRYFQSPEGRMPLNPVDTDARWRTSRFGRAAGLQYQENVIVDRGGFILSRGTTHASERESKAVPDLLDGLPPSSQCRWLRIRVTAKAPSVSYWRNATLRPSSLSEKHGWRVVGGMMG